MHEACYKTRRRTDDIHEESFIINTCWIQVRSQVWYHPRYPSQHCCWTTVTENSNENNWRYTESGTDLHDQFWWQCWALVYVNLNSRRSRPFSAFIKSCLRSRSSFFLHLNALPSNISDSDIGCCTSNVCHYMRRVATKASIISFLTLIHETPPQYFIYLYMRYCKNWSGLVEWNSSY